MPTTTDTPMLVAGQQVGHRFPGTGWLFRRLSFQLTPGRTTAVTGPSGSGKSTLLAIMAGWETPVEGSVAKQGVARVGWVFQNPHGMAHRSALDHVSFPLLTCGLARPDADEQAMGILNRFGLGDVAKRDFADLSGGEAQRLMLARAVASTPDLLLVDEPTAQLDRQAAASVAGVLDEMAGTDLMVVIATHDQAVAAQAGQIIDLGGYRETKVAS